MDYIELKVRVPKPSRRHLQFSLASMVVLITAISIVMGYRLHRRNQSATADGKYSSLLRRIAVAQDADSYGAFRDWGFWSGTSYRSHSNLPPGYWVYVEPDWYIWEKCREVRGTASTRYSFGPRIQFVPSDDW